MKWLLIAALLVTSAVTVSVTTAEAGLKIRKTSSEDSKLTDTVKKIRDDDEGVVILFVKTAGTYYLRRDVAEFDDLRKKLETSLNSKKPVSVTFEPNQLNILEVK